MFNREFKTSFYKESFPTLDPVVTKADRTTVITYKERVEDPNKGLSYRDFSLQSLIDADALDLLNPVSPISRDSLTAADVANNIVGNLSTSLDNVNVEPSKDEVTNE